MANAAVAEATKDNFEEVIFGDKTARWFQVAARNGVASALERGINRILVVQPTGTGCLLYTSPSPRDGLLSRMPSSA